MQEASLPDRVSNDMAAVFAGVQDTRTGGGAGKLTVYPGGAARPRRSLWWRIAAPVVVVMILAGLAAQTGRLGMLPDPPVRAAARHAPRPNLPAPPSPVEEIATATPVLGSAESATSKPAVVAPPPPVRASVTDRAPVADRIATRLIDARPAPASVPRGEADADGCAAGSQEDACIYADVLRADRRLRAAYREASGIGVPADVLNDVNRRWRDARAASLRQPDEAIRRYDRLTALLGDYIAGDR